LALLVLLANATLIHGQESNIPPRGKYKHSKKIVEKYDRFKDRTVVFLYGLTVKGGFSRSVGMATIFNSPGHTVQMPQYVEVFFTSASRQWQIGGDRGLIILADGARYDYGQTKLTDVYISGDIIVDGMDVHIPTPDFLKIINAKTVEMRLGDAEFKLAPDHMEALRDFASRMNP
jgi:hypothetical protein